MGGILPKGLPLGPKYDVYILTLQGPFDDPVKTFQLKKSSEEGGFGFTDEEISWLGMPLFIHQI